MADLSEFVEENPTVRGVRCWACYIPEAGEINSAKRDKTATVTQMIRWLVEKKGYSDIDARVPRLNNHFQQGHHTAYPDGRKG